MTVREFWSRFWWDTCASHYTIDLKTYQWVVVYRWERILTAAGVTR